MSSDEPTDNSRFEEIEERLSRLETTVADLKETMKAQEPDANEKQSATGSTEGSPPTSSEPTDETVSTASSEAPSRKSEAPAESAKARDPEAPSKPERSNDADRLDGSIQSDGLDVPAGSDDLDEAEASSVNDALQHYATILGLRSADWISYVGIGLLLFGLAFLFRFSIEQGWITPKVRVGFGALLGVVLLLAGIRRAGDRPLLQQILFGGSSATFYGTVFAAYQLYDLLAYPVAFGGMLFITVATIILGLRQDYASTAFIGTAGGLGTPFLLFTQADGGVSLALYTCVVVSGACVIYLYRGWRSLMYLALAGGWSVLLLAVQGAEGDARWGLQFSIFLGWILIGGTPVLRSTLHTHQPQEWPSIEIPQSTWLSSLSGDHPPSPVLVSPAMAFLATRLIWPDAPDSTWAILAGIGTLIYGGLYWQLRRNDLISYAPVHGVVAAVLATYGLSQVLRGPAMLVAWGVEAALLPNLSRRLNDTLLRISGHVLAAVLFTSLFGRFLFTDPASPPLVSPEALAELMTLGLLASIPWRTDSRHLKPPYQIGLIVGWLGWWAHKLSVLDPTSSYVLIVASLSALLLLLSGHRWRLRVPRFAAHMLFGICALVIAERLFDGSTASVPVVHLSAISELLVLGTGVLAARVQSDTAGRRLYQGGVLLGWLGWTLHELVVLPNGQAYVSVVWGGTAVLLLIGGAWVQRPVFQKSGLAVLGLFVLKLFFVDLAALPTLGRIGLFLGSGAGFLLISYLLPGVGEDVGEEES